MKHGKYYVHLFFIKSSRSYIIPIPAFYDILWLPLKKYFLCVLTLPSTPDTFYQIIDIDNPEEFLVNPIRSVNYHSIAEEALGETRKE